MNNILNIVALDKDQTINSGYGYRKPPTDNSSNYHSGIDVTLSNDAVPSITGGVVEYVGYSSSGGNMVYIRNNDGTLAKYMHLDIPSTLSVGETVTMGQTIGVQGNTGNSTGKHLHLSIQDAEGAYINPVDYMADGVTEIPTDTTKKNSTINGTVNSIASTLIKFIAILLLIVLASYLFMKSFDISII